MKIDLVKISKIKTKKKLKEYKTDKPIFLSNYLFHYFIITNNLDGLKLKKFPIYKLDQNDRNGFQLAAYYDNYDILRYLINEYPEYIYNKSDNRNFLWYLTYDTKEFEKFLFDVKLNFDLLFYDYAAINKDEFVNVIGSIFNTARYGLLKKIIDKFNINYEDYKYRPLFLELLDNDHLNSKKLIKLFDIIKKKLKKEIYEYYDDLGYNICWNIISKRDMNLIKYFNDCNYQDSVPITSYNLFRTIYNTDLHNNDFKITKFVWKKIKKKFNYKTINKYGDNLGHFILQSYTKNGIGDIKLIRNILKDFNFWNFQNIDKMTPLHYIVLTDFKKFSSLLKGKNLNLSLKNNNGLTCLDLAGGKWKNYFKKFPRYKEDNKNNNDLKVFNYKYVHGNIYQAKFLDLAIYILILSRKYSQLYLPNYIDNSLENITWDGGLSYPDSYLEEYLNFPWIIIWNRKGNYWVHPYLNQLINSVRRDKSHDFCVVMLSIRLPDDGLHAGMIIYDFVRNTVERFDPYGDTTKLDTDIDYILEEELTWNTGLTYLKPNDYMTTSGFQTLSNENELQNQKYGDFGGYCLAWCLWYLELKINNSNLNSKKIFEKGMNKLLSNDLSFTEYIRNYANNLNKKRVKLLKKIGIPNNKISNEYLEIKYSDMIFEYIIDKM